MYNTKALLFVAGDTLWLDTWDGWTEFLRDSLNGNKNKVLSHFSKDKPIIRSSYYLMPDVFFFYIFFIV